MNYLKKRTEEAKEKEEVQPPNWVSDKNSSYKAWLYVEEAKKEKKLYIKHHHRVTDFREKNTYKIKGSVVADSLGINRSTLMNRSSYSGDFAKYLDDVNSELEIAKENSIKKSKENKSRGTIRSSKSELVDANRKLKDQITTLQSQKTEELVRYAFDQLPLPVKKKLGID